MKNDGNTNNGAKLNDSLDASKKVADILRRIMADKNIKQSAMADFAKTSTSQFSRMINGKLEFSLQHIANIATELGMEMEEIFTYKKDNDEKGKMNTTREKEDDMVSVTFQVDRKQRDYLLHLVMGDTKEIK